MTSANAVTLDSMGNAYITGFTQGITPGTTPGAYRSQVIDRCTPALGIGPSPPYTGTGNAFALKLDSAFSTSLVLTYLGGSCNDSGTTIAVDKTGNIWVAGFTQSSDFPLLVRSREELTSALSRDLWRSLARMHRRFYFRVSPTDPAWRLVRPEPSMSRERAEPPPR
ncbi:MAG: SBBP repeat-containing protein [Bryobacterales bacterium]|nr:SBBP repeat-containing protein [Bryobacterales bacterium]